MLSIVCCQHMRAGMRFTSFVAIAFMLAGCATYRNTIELSVVGAAPSFVVSDERWDEEKRWKGGPIARCLNHGRDWTGIPDEAFEQSRPRFLAARLGAAFGDRIHRVSLRHFQNCYQVGSGTRAAPLAGFSVPLAIVVDSMLVRGKDQLLTYIAVVVDGKEYTTTDARAYVERGGMGYGFLEAQTAAAITSSTEAAMAELIRKISADLEANSRTAGGDGKTPR